MKYSPKVCATILVLIATPRTRNDASTQHTLVFYTEESDSDDSDDENGESVTKPPSHESVGEPVEDAISTMRAEISELDTMAFDETVALDESVDM